MGPGRDLDTFCAAISPRLVGSLVLFCGDRAVAEDVAQDALARTVERWDRVGVMASPEAWTYRTALNLARTRARRHATERRATARLAGEAVRASLPDTTAAIAVRDAVLRLPRRQRAAVIARFYAGLSVADAATALQCAPGTVKALVHQAVASLRDAGLTDVDAPDDEAFDDENDKEGFDAASR